jgi:ferric-dicitrate binding protein FerR (iron transport regulator)
LDQQKILELIHKHANNTATEAERDALMAWYHQKDGLDREYPDTEDAVEDRMLARLLAGVPQRKSNKIKIFAAVAAVLFLLGSAVLFQFYNKRNTDPGAIAHNTNVIKPGSNKAILTLSNGSKIELNKAGNGTVGYQKGMRLIKSANGQLVYSASNDLTQKDLSPAGKLEFNEIQTPKGGQFEVVLPDGSKVWLNSESSVRFPVSFVSLKERRVELDGEAYFEVTHNVKQPFRVSSGKQVVEVLGTHFDIMSYDKLKGIKTTLLQGSVKVSGNGDGKAVLKPGQQSIYTNENKISVSTVKVEQVVAWKNGYFLFDDERLEDIIATISRWYDFNAVFEDNTLKDEKFGAFTARFSDISTLLDVISRTGNVKFDVQGKNIRIMRKQ